MSKFVLQCWHVTTVFSIDGTRSDAIRVTYVKYGLEYHVSEKVTQLDQRSLPHLQMQRVLERL